MNSYERTLAVLNGDIPDRVPTFELLIDKRVIKAVVGSDDYPAFCEEVELDIVVTGTPSKLYEEKPLDAARGLYINEWGIIRHYGGETVSVPAGGPLVNPSDIETYRPPDPYDERRYRELSYLLKRFKGKKLVGMHLHDALNYPYYLRGMERFFMDTIENPDLVYTLVQMSVDHNIAIAERAVDMGADFIIVGDDYGTTASTLMSPQAFRTFIIPGLKKVVETVKAQGALCFKHCCGNINTILDDIVETGIDALHPFDAAAGMDIAAAKNNYPHLTVMGGVNCAAPLTDYPVDALVKEVEKVLEQLMPGGRYILASSNSIHHRVKVDNVLAMWETVRKKGVYS